MYNHRKVFRYTIFEKKIKQRGQRWPKEDGIHENAECCFDCAGSDADAG